MNHPPDHNQRPLRLHLANEAATKRLGQSLARSLAPGMRIYLRGDLGSGKTALVRAILRALGVGGHIKSPTYALVELYIVSRLHLYHFDFYRFRDPVEWQDAGFEEYFGGSGVCLVEWPERAGEYLPPPDIEIMLSFSGAGRDAQIIANSDAGAKCIEIASDLDSQKESS